MSLKRLAGKRPSSDSGVEPDRGALSQEKRDQRVTLFLRDFDQQAKERVQEMERELDLLLQIAEKAFTVELLKMPVAIRKMKRKDWLSKWSGIGIVSYLQGMQTWWQRDVPLTNVSSCLSNIFLVKVTTIVEYEDAKHISAKKISKKVS
ncbi:BORE2 protein, partial [Podargus strigoides]|nr:BORE2 protein [Podargus strigoides]